MPPASLAVILTTIVVVGLVVGALILTGGGVGFDPSKPVRNILPGLNRPVIGGEPSL